MKHFIFSGLLGLICCLSFSEPTLAQSSTYEALQTFLRTDFFDQYLEFRDRAEESVRQFKRIQFNYDDQDVQDVRDAYDASAEYFNAVLINVKNDLLHKKKRAYIIDFPHSYSKQMDADLYKASEYYAKTFQQTIADVTEGEILGAPLIAMLPALIKATKMATEILKKIEKEIKKFNEDLVNQHLVEAYRFKSWDEIE